MPIHIQEKPKETIQMDCKKCPDKNFCYSLKSGTDFNDKAQFHLAYLRTLRCKKKKFGN